MYRLINQAQGYVWGSTSTIPNFLGGDTSGEPVAEVWMGTHALAPSTVEAERGERLPLTEVAGELPFLMKILAADKPLSLQVHPSRALAEAGFAAEEAQGIALDAPNRSYKDPHHKPEMAYALTTFDSLVGFRPTAEILRVLSGIDTPLTQRLAEQLRAKPGFKGIVRMLAGLLDEDHPVGPDEIRRVADACRDALDRGMDIKRAYATAVEVAVYFPEDVGTVVSLLLNRLTLQPGEAAFLGAGIIHAHLSGMCLEVMACSDNVLRAGLTTKHIDRQGLVRCLDKGMSRVARVTPHQVGFSTDVFSPDVDEFALAVTQCSLADVDGVELPSRGARILICTGGYVDLENEAGQSIKMARGDSVFASASDGLLKARGIGEVAQAYAPHPDAPAGAMVDLV